MKDDRIFRVTKSKYRGEKLQYCTRTAVSGMFARGYYLNGKRPDILTVEATNAEATEGWTDVTDEFRNPPERVTCIYHKAYTGMQKPRDRENWYGNRCTCWNIYTENHPAYPTHSDLCSKPNTDPATCDCKMLRRLLD